MKVKVTRSLLKSHYNRAIAIGYCDAYSLLYFENPEYYTAGIYGWNFDAYDIDGVLITTGYRGMIGVTPNYERLRFFNKKSEDVINSKITFEEKKKKVSELLKDFIKETLN